MLKCEKNLKENNNKKHQRERKKENWHDGAMYRDGTLPRVASQYNVFEFIETKKNETRKRRRKEIFPCKDIIRHSKRLFYLITSHACAFAMWLAAYLKV